MERAALYIRVSTEEQAMRGLSLTAQRDTLMEYIKRNKYRLAGVYADEGVTARKKYTRRPAFVRMLEDVRKGLIDVILFIKLDRWFRNIADYYEVQKILDAYHTNWIATEEDYDTTTANGRLHLNIKLSIAQDESDRTSERIKFVFDGKRKRGEALCGKVPIGYRIENKKLVIDRESASMAVDIFNQYQVLRSVRALDKYIMEKYDKLYSYSALRGMLQNTRYIGMAYDQEDYCPVLIDKAVFAQTQAIIAERSQRNAAVTPRIYLFTGLAVCGECGKRMGVETIKEKYVYYRCTRFNSLSHPCTHKRRISEKAIEDWLLGNLVSEFESYNLELSARAQQQPAKVDEVKIKRKMEKLKDLYLNDLIDRDSYERDYTALRDTLRDSITQRNQLPSPIAIAPIESALAAYTGLTRKSKKEFWNRTISKILVTNDGQFFVSPF